MDPDEAFDYTSKIGSVAPDSVMRRLEELTKSAKATLDYIDVIEVRLAPFLKSKNSDEKVCASYARNGQDSQAVHACEDIDEIMTLTRQRMTDIVARLQA